MKTKTTSPVDPRERVALAGRLLPPFATAVCAPPREGWIPAVSRRVRD
ncbi:MAG: hypothetical protein IPN65_01275 [Elusimicrobia bacterium]|nr:hypothetical protein [Elusimicrobiota bacterium]MBK7206995.1 hypothetical protein [Elusimicrobiota bacterium]MBK7545815.1 hypothetical protein [Elusimicrobiota bacterium]MBK7575079.1 hypothetical protein [Elusimicrobiota bacterium]MBK7687655.1 hypothetical protein [Elusimicrobiota bacterium]